MNNHLTTVPTEILYIILSKLDNFNDIKNVSKEFMLYIDFETLFRFKFNEFYLDIKKVWKYINFKFFYEYEWDVVYKVSLKNIGLIESQIASNYIRGIAIQIDYDFMIFNIIGLIKLYKLNIPYLMESLREFPLDKLCYYYISDAMNSVLHWHCDEDTSNYFKDILINNYDIDQQEFSDILNEYYDHELFYYVKILRYKLIQENRHNDLKTIETYVHSSLSNIYADENKTYEMSMELVYDEKVIYSF